MTSLTGAALLTNRALKNEKEKDIRSQVEDLRKSVERLQDNFQTLLERLNQSGLASLICVHLSLSA